MTPDMILAWSHFIRLISVCGIILVGSYILEEIVVPIITYKPDK